MGTATVSPAHIFPGNNSQPAFTHAIETVRSARNAVPSICPVRAHTPDGISTAALQQSCSFIHRIMSQYLPDISLLKPTPNTASIITVYSFCGISVNILMPMRSAIFFWMAHSRLREVSFPAKSTSTCIPSSARRRATAKPSPPLFPLPQTTRVRAVSISLSCITSTTLSAARSISTMDGTPSSSIVYVSADLI